MAKKAPVRDYFEWDLGSGGDRQAICNQPKTPPTTTTHSTP